MKKVFKVLAVALMLVLPFGEAWGQCASLFKQGEALMKKKKYEAAIKTFQAAMECDTQLTEKCEAKIRVCKSRINPTPKPALTIRETGVITVGARNLSFGPETTSPKYVKVSSTPKEWSIKCDADWCTPINKEVELSVSCSINEDATPRQTVIVIDNGKAKETINVIQEAAEEILNITEEKIEIIGLKEEVLYELQLETNTDWEVVDKPEWCQVLHQADRTWAILKISAGKKARQATLIIRSKSGKKISSVILSQRKKKLFE